MRNFVLLLIAVMTVAAQNATVQGQQAMDQMWGESVVKLRAENARRGQLFDEGNYAMFIHWGLYSMLGNQVDGKTYYGIGEWIMNPRMAGIPVDEYKQLAKRFNPVDFDAKKIVAIAKDAGMKYIVITAKHHDGFAMYDSDMCDFNIADATPWQRDPMGELANACRDAGLGIGFYYSHNQDWTFPGGGNGPKVDDQGQAATFDDYFVNKCLPQVNEITTKYGPIELVWFDTPGKMPKHYVQQLVELVHKNQPNALVSGRAGHGLGDYQTLGDMEVPHQNVPGMWESVDTTNDSWAYAWYDENWKSPKEILKRLVACVGRGGTYMLNIGPKGDGSVPGRAAASLKAAGDWIRRYPQVIYGTDASPWQHALPWGDVTRKDNTLFLCVFRWPDDGRLYVPNLLTSIQSARLLGADSSDSLPFRSEQEWAVIELPPRPVDPLVSVIQLDLKSPPKVDPVWAVDPAQSTEVLAEFAEADHAVKEKRRWMEKFGEWKGVVHVHDFGGDGRAVWKLDVHRAGTYQVDLVYSGTGRLVWQVGIDGGEKIQNQQNASHNYQAFPIGWLSFPEPGTYSVFARCIDGDVESASLKSIQFDPVELMSDANQE
ncbi:alpha-L-fucosidase [Crateriforma conspicua]|uniref:alpha-L-fucosidase n=1 Tax=Crateriforma conspicua TaxID=2527996 RepID=A0A5C5Y6T6_9PLAN|nr:alpha-L-fucosidase [Crateriforma conspicua]TWT71356.1 Alpha-L-fucosidase [Crateriforma conspicua]